MEKQTHTMAWRIGFYAIGLVVLAVGITLNTKTGLGVSPIISVPFAISGIWDVNFAATTFIIYVAMVALQFVLKGSRREWRDILQIPFSLVFSILLDFFGEILAFSYTELWQNLLLLLAAIVITAVGAAITVNMRIIPNPADGMSQVLGDVLGRGMGFGKNVMDISCVAITCIIELAATGRLSAIGLGTVIAMIGVGRVIALFNYLFRQKMARLTGLSA